MFSMVAIGQRLLFVLFKHLLKLNISMRLGHRVMNMLKKHKLLQMLSGIPILNIPLQPKTNRRLLFNRLLLFFVMIPCFGFFRRQHLRKKFARIIQKEKETSEVQLKESLNKFDLSIPGEVDYMVIIICDSTSAEDEQFSKIDEENSKKLFEFNEEITHNPDAQELKYVFIGSNKIYESIRGDRTINIEFHDSEKIRREPKVYLLARQLDDSQKIIMEWGIGVPFSAISKHISKHKYKKYVGSINF